MDLGKWDIGILYIILVTFPQDQNSFQIKSKTFLKGILYFKNNVCQFVFLLVSIKKDIKQSDR